MNKYILEFCENYFLSQVNPEYAVLLKGPWGCGKTYFINQFEQYMTEKGHIEEKDILNISIFGVTTIDELEDRIFEVLHPIRSSNYGKFASTVMKKAIEKGTSIDIGEFTKKSINLDDLKKKILIIDDIERSELSPTKLLGYLSTYIIDEGIRMILICNEDEYAIKFKDEIHNYEKISEKVIGYKFEIKPDNKLAINCFCEEFKLKENIPKSLEIVNNVMSKLKINNLRVIRRAIQSFNYIYSIIPEDYKNISYLEELFECYLIAFIQYTMGEIDKSQIEKSIAAYYNHNASLKEYNEKITDKDKGTWDLLLHKQIPLKEYLEGIICDGRLDREVLCQQIKLEIDNIKGKNISNLYYLKNNWNRMESKEFEETVNKVTEEFKQGTYKHPGDILNFVDTMMTYNDFNMIPYNEEDIMNIANELITLKKDIILPMTLSAFGFDSYGGFGFRNIENENFKELKNLIEKISKENTIKAIKVELDRYISNIDSEYNEFISHIYLVNGSGRYREYPIMSYIDVDKLFNKLMKLDIKIQDSFLYALRERYGMKYSNGTFEQIYFDDYENVCKLYSLYLNKYNTENKIFNPKTIMMKFIVDKLEEMKKYMELYMENDKSNLEEGENIEYESQIPELC